MPGRPLQQLLPIDSFDVGSILYLRRREEVLDEHVVAAQIEDGFLDHPCLVVEKPKSRKDYVCICPVSSKSSLPAPEVANHGVIRSLRSKAKRFHKPENRGIGTIISPSNQVLRIRCILMYSFVSQTVLNYGNPVT